MRIAQHLYAQLVEHALYDAPRECCGLIAARDGEAMHVFRCENVAYSEFRFEIDGLEQQRVTDSITAAGWSVGAIYHSHTRAPAYPSKLDILTHRYPEVLCIIVGVGVSSAVPTAVRAFRIRDERVIEDELSVQR